MRSFRTKAFKRLYNKLPDHVKEDALEAYGTFKLNPQAKSLRPRTINCRRGQVFRVELVDEFRAVAFVGKQGDETVYEWDFVGSHDDYMKYIN